MLLNVRLMGFGFVFGFFLHNSSLVCMVRITYVYIDMVFGFYEYFLSFFKYLSQLDV